MATIEQTRAERQAEAGRAVLVAFIAVAAGGFALGLLVGAVLF